MPSERDFSLEGYRALIEALLARGYMVRSFMDARPEKRHLILRHDLDMSLEAALPVAEVERDLGMTATYFVLLRGELYNPFTPGARKVLDEIRALGHELGLHFDGSLYSEDRSSLDAAAARECALLETGLGIDVRIISFHRPAEALLGMNGRLAGRLHAYAPRFFRDMGYCSDSRGAWHHGHPLDHPAVSEGRALQLLTHPIWWADGMGATVGERLDRFAEEQYDLLRQELARNCEPYREHLETRGRRSGSNG